MSAKRRQPTRKLDYIWPFLFTGCPGRGLVHNILVIAKERKRVIKAKGNK